MALRLIQVFIINEKEAEARDLIEEQNIRRVWREEGPDGYVRLVVLVHAEAAESVLDWLEKRFSTLEGFLGIILPVEASIPREKTSEETPPAEKPPANGEAPPAHRVHREELYADVTDQTDLSRVFLTLVVLSTVVCAVGLLRGQVAIIIGAMVIAPMLGPNVALALATTLGDKILAAKSVKALAAATALALSLSAGLGYFLQVDPDISEIALRTRVGLGDVALALASGVAAALSVTQGMATAIIGVMVAVSLLPPLATGGLLLGAGQTAPAMGAFLLFTVNVICVNLSGVTAFLLQGVRPLEWVEKTRARHAVRFALFLWLTLLSAMVVWILFTQG